MSTIRRRLMMYSSPYNAATTAYLKATYPIYWNDIKHYGYDHPELVPYIEEDNDLICSLVDVGVTRLLVGDGLAYINSGYKANQDSDLDFMFKLVTLPPSGGSGITGSREAYDSKAIGAFDTPEGKIYADFYTSKNRCSATSGIGIMNRIRVNKDRVIVNEQTAICQPIPSSWETITNIFIFNYSGNPSPAWVKTKQAFAYYKDKGKREMYPFIRGGENGMIDLIYGTFYPNANSIGSFTVEKTTNQ